MTLAQRIEMFFTEWELVWASIPGGVRAAVYAFLTAVIATYLDKGAIDWKFVLIAVVSNIGLYQVPREIRNMGR